MRLRHLDILVLLEVALVAASNNLENEPIAQAEDCKKDITVLQNLCEIKDEDLTNNWAVLDCIDSLPADKQISQECDNHVWKFKLEVTRQDVFLDQAKEICEDGASLLLAPGKDLEGSFRYPLGREGVYSPGGTPFLAHAMQKVSNIVGLRPYG